MSRDDQVDGPGHEPCGPPRVGQFASAVISLVHDRQAVTGAGVRQFVLDHLLRALTCPRHFDPVMMMEEMRGHRLSVDLIIDTYIPCAARSLGVLWLRDDLSFAQVTIGALRLQALLGEASAEQPLRLVPDARRLRMLVLVPQGEQHFLGAHVVAAQLRRMGFDVATSFDETLGELRARLRKEPPNLVLVTSSQAQDLVRIAQTVQTMRTALPDGPVIALGGALTGEAALIREQTGVDLVTSEIREAVAFCSARMKAMAGR